MQTHFEFSTVLDAAASIKSDVLFVTIFAPKESNGDKSNDKKDSLTFDATLTALDKATSGKLKQFLDKGHFPQKAGDYRTFYDLDGIAADALVVVNVKPSRKGLAKCASIAANFITKHKIASATFADNALATEGVDVAQGASILAKGLIDTAYACDDYKSTKADSLTTKVTVVSDATINNAVIAGINEGQAIGRGMNTYKDLGNAPGNVCTPKYLANFVKKLAKDLDNTDVSVLKEFGIEELGMGALLSVSQGSAEKPRLITIEYKGGKGDPIVLIGKGVTFDTGGISLKGGQGMEDMKYDMCGAATVVGVLQAVAEMQLPINVVGIIPSVENMPSAKAVKPGDIVTSMSGKTIEVINTDAEGRLILCDAITYSARFNPKAVIDIATLTGAAIVALGAPNSGLMSYDDKLSDDLLKAGEQADDTAWRLPLGDEYVEMIESKFADLRNLGKGREAGTIVAGAFLGEFAKDKDLRWAHLDIAASAGIMTAKPSGRPVPLLVQYLKNRAS